MESQNYVEINATKSSKLLHDLVPAIFLWILIVIIIMVFIQSFVEISIVSKRFVGVIAILTLPIILYFTYIQSKSYKLDSIGLTITSSTSTNTIPWERIETIAKVIKDESSLMYEVLDMDGKKYGFPLDSKRGRTESFLDSLPQLTVVPTKALFDNYSARWKNVTSTTYKYTSFADKLSNFSYGNPNP